MENQMSKSWVRTLWVLRFSAPTVLLLAAANGLWAYSQGRNLSVAINAILVVANLYLTYVEWFVLQPGWPGRRMRHGIF
jgi:hypothetical protein